MILREAALPVGHVAAALAAGLGCEFVVLSSPIDAKPRFEVSRVPAIIYLLDGSGRTGQRAAMPDKARRPAKRSLKKKCT